MKKLAALLCSLLLWLSPAQAAGIFWWDGAAWDNVITPYWWDGSTWRTVVGAWWWDGSNWRPSYSTITVSASNATGSGSGNSSSGTVTTGTPGTTTGGYPIGSPTYAWSYVSGDSGITVSSSTAQNPTWSETITGVTSGNTVTHTALWQIVATDPATSIASTPAQITVSVSWQNTGSSLAVSSAGCTSDVVVFSPATQVVACNATATATGGSGSYTAWQWTLYSGGNVIVTTAPTSQNTTMETNGAISTCGAGCTNSVSTYWTVTVTDSMGNQATSAPVYIELSLTQSS